MIMANVKLRIRLRKGNRIKECIPISERERERGRWTCPLMAVKCYIEYEYKRI